MATKEPYDRTIEPNEQLHILLAEDDLEMRRLLSWSLARKGYDVTECTDGTALLRKLGLLGPVDRTEPYHLIISDIRMPGTTGLQVLENMRDFPDFPPMILITAFPTAEARRKAMRLGAVAMLAKPFDIDELLDQVQRTLHVPSAQRTESSPAPSTGRLRVPFDITFRHGSGSQAVKDYVENMITKMHAFLDHIVSGKIIVDQSEVTKHKKHRYRITLVIATSGKQIVVKRSTDKGVTDDNLYMAINMVFGSATRKLKHYIEKRQAHRRVGIKSVQRRQAGWHAPRNTR